MCPGGDFDDSEQGSGSSSVQDPHRAQAIGSRPVTQLAVSVEAPTSGGAVGDAGAGVVVAGHDLGDVGLWSGPGNIQDFDLSQVIGRGAVTEFARVVEAPTARGVVGHPDAGMELADRDLEDV